MDHRTLGWACLFFATSLLGCQRSGAANADWYGYCIYPGGWKIDVTLYDLVPAEEGSQLASSVGDWRIQDGTADIANDDGRAESVALLSAVCLSEEGCNQALDPYVQHQRLFDLNAELSDLDGVVVLKGMPDNPDSPTRYEGECSHSVRSGRGSFVLEREPISPPSDEPDVIAPDAGCPGADLASDDANCGVCGNVCSAGGCLLGQCPEQRERRQRIDLAAGEVCVVHGGDVLCFPVVQTAPTSPLEVTLAYDGGDAIQAVQLAPHMCILKSDGSTSCFEHSDTSAATRTAPAPWTNVLEIASDGSGLLAGVDADGDLLWFRDPVLPDIWDVPPQTGISRLGGTGSPHTLSNICWQEVAGPVRCKYSGDQGPRTPGPVLDFDGGYVAVNENGEVCTIVSYLIAPLALGVGNAVAVSEGSEVFCALISDGTVECWHTSNGGWELNPDPNCDTLPLTPGEPHPCLRYQGASEETSGPVPGLDDAIAVVSGVRSSCALRADDTVLCWSGADPTDSWSVDLTVSP